MITILTISLPLLLLGLVALSHRFKLKDLSKETEWAREARNLLCKEIEELRLVADRRHNDVDAALIVCVSLNDGLRRDVNHILRKLGDLSSVKPPLAESTFDPTKEGAPIIDSDSDEALLT